MAGRIPTKPSRSFWAMPVSDYIVSAPLLLTYQMLLAHMSVEDTLEKVHFEWHSSRSVQVKIRDAVFTFST